MNNREKAKRELTLVRSSMTRMYNAVSSSPGYSVEAAQLRLVELESLFEKMKMFTVQAMENDTDDDGEIKTFEVYESKYYSCKEILLKDIAGRQNSTVASISSDTSATKLAIKLPAVTIPTFDGEFSSWDSFRDLFEATIHTNETLSKVQKLTYLKSLVSGEAAGLIRSIQVTEAHYSIAWQILMSHYNQPKLIVNNLIEKLMGLPALSSGKMNVRSFYSQIDEIWTMLECSGDYAQSVHPWFIYLVQSKLDSDIAREWSLESSDIKEPKSEDMRKFLKKVSTVEIVSKSSQFKSKQSMVSSSRRVNVANISSSKSTKSCRLCCKDHTLSQCDEFKTKSIEERIRYVKIHGFCFNCLKRGHSVKSCNIQITCKKCNGRHHTLIHNRNPANTENLEVEDSLGNSPSGNEQVNVMNVRNRSYYNSILPTASCLVKNSFGEFTVCRVMLDTGAEVNLITEELSRKLGLPRENLNLQIASVTSKTSSTKGKYGLTIASRFNKREKIQVDAFVLPELMDYHPSSKIKLRSAEKIKHFKLADPDYETPSKIDMILGVDAFFEILKSDRWFLKDDGVWLHETTFGYIIAGGKFDDKSVVARVNSISTVSDECLNKTLTEFWKIEDVNREIKPIDSEDQCERYFLDNTKLLDNGRIEVKLPFKQTPPNLGESREICTKRFLSLERRLSNDNELREKYIEFMRNYLQSGHMVEIKPSFNDEGFGSNCYLPHHGVLQRSGNKSKLRVVFDASCKTGNKVSLNDELLGGPNIHLRLDDILVRFRLNRFAFSADIEQMYRQILVAPEDRPYQRIVWRENPKMPLKQFELVTVTYGTASAPFLARRSLLWLADRFRNEFPAAADIITNNTYMDDSFAGGDSLEEALLQKNELISLLKIGGFKLRKWVANKPELLSEIPKEDWNIPSSIIIEEEGSTKTLGLWWQPWEDFFHFKIKLCESITHTKRALVSEIARVYDPLGFISPVIINLKILLQDVWLEKVDWDSELSEKISKKWFEIRKDLPHIEDLRIPRFLGERGDLYLIGFSDASQRAYAATVYSLVRTSPPNVMLLSSKTKVAPLKPVTIARLELCGAQLLTRLMKKLASTLNVDEGKCFCFCDSSIVLNWLSSYPQRWKPFVANRVNDIQETLPNCKWQYVNTKENPADVASRGCSSSYLLKHNLWWKGPPWLSKGILYHPRNMDIVTEDQDQEIRETHKALVVKIESNPFDEFIAKFSSWYKLKKCYAWMLRFFEYIKSRTKVPTGNLTTYELKTATTLILRRLQAIHYPKEALGKMLHTGPLRQLSPFIDDDKLLRVGGRLHNSDLDYTEKHPIIVPRGHISDMIIQETHIQRMHGGIDALVYAIRKKYWIIGLKTLVKKCLHNCITCTRDHGRAFKPPMGPLPRCRVAIDRAFLNVGIDFAGPVLILPASGRGRKPIKGYIAVFICMATKALHLELVMGLDTASFVMALERFVSRRGLCKSIWSDNGRNFVGADRTMKDAVKVILKQNPEPDLRNYLLKNEITWHFTPPATPHYGGIWEAGVKSVKTHLRRSFKNRLFTIEEYITVLSKIEAILNSRPLSPMSENSNDLNVLTPAHFLIGDCPTAIPEEILDNCDVTFSKRYQLHKQLLSQFWKTWRSDYLHSLQVKKIWHKLDRKVMKGDLVLIKRAFQRPLEWPIGRVVETYMGSDGVARTANVLSNRGLNKESVTNLILLPLKPATSMPGTMN